MERKRFLRAQGGASTKGKNEKDSEKKEDWALK